MDTRDYEAKIAEMYHYEKLDPTLSSSVRSYYYSNIPAFLMTGSNDHPIFSKKGTLIAKKYDRIVVGDYGAFIEFSAENAATINYVVKPGQEYRINDPRYKDNVKYLWYTLPGEEDEVKLYYQMRTVTYADYIPGKYYLSVHEAANFVLFTHIDLDGYGSEVMVRAMYPDIKSYNVNYGFDSDPNYRKIMAQATDIIFADISISASTAITLDNARRRGEKNLILLDHHKSAYDRLAQLEFDWIIFDENKSGALIAWDYFHKKDPTKMEPYKDLAEVVSDYDLWIHKDPRSIQLQFLWSKIKDTFVERFTLNPNLKFSDSEYAIVKASTDELAESYSDAMLDIEKLTDCEGLTFLLVPRCKSLLSLVAKMILETGFDYHLDYIAILNNGGISFRSLEYPVRVVAESLGGGGHDLSAGAKVPEGLVDIKSSIINRKWINYDMLGGNHG